MKRNEKIKNINVPVSSWRQSLLVKTFLKQGRPLDLKSSFQTLAPKNEY